MAKRKLDAAEALALERHDKRVTELEGQIRSADQNLVTFSDFSAEADARLALATVSESEKETWKSRKAHCETVQKTEEENKKAVAQSLLKGAKDALEAEKKRLKAEKGADGWYVEA